MGEREGGGDSVQYTLARDTCMMYLLGISKDGEEHFEDIYMYIFKRLGIRRGEGGREKVGRTV